LHACGEFVQPERAGEELVRSRLESKYLKGLLNRFTQEHHRHVGGTTVRAQPSADLESVDFSHGELKQNDLRTGRGSPGQSLRSVADGDYGEPFRRETALERLRDLGSVFDEKDSSVHAGFLETRPLWGSGCGSVAGGWRSDSAGCNPPATCPSLTSARLPSSVRAFPQRRSPHRNPDGTGSRSAGSRRSLPA